MKHTINHHSLLIRATYETDQPTVCGFPLEYPEEVAYIAVNKKAVKVRSLIPAPAIADEYDSEEYAKS